MARPRFATTAQREARQRLIDSAPLIGDHAGVHGLSVTLTFVDPEGKQQPSPRAITYMSDARAYFQFACPMRECVDGGFDATDDVSKALARHRDGHTGALSCRGVRPRGGIKNNPCNIELRYAIEIR